MVDTSSKKEETQKKKQNCHETERNTDFQRKPHFVKCESCYFPHHNIQILYGNYYSLEKNYIKKRIKSNMNK